MGASEELRCFYLQSPAVLQPGVRSSLPADPGGFLLNESIFNNNFQQNMEIIGDVQ
jgi:hypothetical protein